MAEKNKQSKKANASSKKKTGKSNVIWIVAGFAALCVLIFAGIRMIRSDKGTDAAESVPTDIENSLVIEQADNAEAQAIAEESEKHEDAVAGFSDIAQAGKNEDKETEEPDQGGEDGMEPGIEPGTFVPGSDTYVTPEPDTDGSISSPSSAPTQPVGDVTVTSIDPTPIPTIDFPYAIPGTDLTILQVSPYSGYYLEDGSGDRVSNVMTIVLKNNGGDLSFAGIGVSQGDRNLAFTASSIPAGSTVIIQEQNRAAYMDGSFYSATATTSPSDGLTISSDVLAIEDNGDNTFTVTNVSGTSIGSAVISYKSYLKNEDVYVGGITYTINLTGLEPDTPIVVESSHYVSGYSVIVSATAA